MNKRIRQINFVFLIMVVLPYIALFLPIRGLVMTPLGNILYSQFIRFAPIAVFFWMNRYHLKDDLRIKKIKISSVFLLIVLAYLITPVMNLISALSLLVGKNVMNDTMTNLTTSMPLAVCVLAIGLLPAICEETIYRGAYLNEYGRIDKKWAIFMSAFLFGVLHQNFNQFTYAFAMGIVFALVVEATGSILSSVIMHCVINSTSVVNLYLYPKMLQLLEKFYGSDQFNAEEIYETAMASSADRVVIIQTILHYCFPALICGILAFFMYRWIAKREGRYEQVKEIFLSKKDQETHMTASERKGQVVGRMKDLITLPLVIGVALCMVEIIASML